jgi:hypothetical protein
MASSNRTLPLPPDKEIATTTIAILSSTLALAVTLFVARIYTRAKTSGKLGFDDFALCLAIPLTIFGYATIVAGSYHGLGHHAVYLKRENLMYLAHVDFIRLICWLWSSTLIRCSVGLMLIRLKSNRVWVYGIGTIITIEVATAIVGTILNCVRCIPIQANWDRSIRGAKCWTPEQNQIVLYTISSKWTPSYFDNSNLLSSGISITVDIIFSILPLTFILNLHLRKVEKFVLAFIMSLGLMASAAAIVKITKFRVYDIIRDPSYTVVPAALWSRIEEHLGIIAACIPCLRAHFKRAMKRLGLMTRSKGSIAAKGDYSYSRTGASGGRMEISRTDELTLEIEAKDGSSTERIDDAKCEC